MEEKDVERRKAIDFYVNAYNKMKKTTVATLEMVTPEMAQRWLDVCNTHNRPLYQYTIAAYARDILNEMYGPNHQGIAFDESGVLTDGQQRLSAIVSSGIPIPLWVFRGVPAFYESTRGPILTQMGIDGGKRRGTGDQLKINYGMENANLRAAIVNAVCVICTRTNRKMTPGLSKAIFDIYGNEIDAVIEHRVTMPPLLNGSVLGSFAFAAKAFRDETIDFEDGYFSGENLATGSPILCFRNYMLGRGLNRNGGGSVREQIMCHALNSIMHHIQGSNQTRNVYTSKGLDWFAKMQSGTVKEVRALVGMA